MIEIYLVAKKYLIRWKCCKVRDFYCTCVSVALAYQPRYFIFTTIFNFLLNICLGFKPTWLYQQKSLRHSYWSSPLDADPSAQPRRYWVGYSLQVKKRNRMTKYR
ncbi:Uncharacterized protein HZ326_14898 [Fusarium oxysporum f. sp. albedinis]|nr:Uncharacterized protein HZ326_14898 [Fusarium oxysporum f. sp. albedinis]